MHLGTHLLQLRSLDRPMFQGQPDLIQSARILAKAMIGSFGRFDLQLEIGYKRRSENRPLSRLNAEVGTFGNFSEPSAIALSMT
jgi:hypothetical protein